MEATILKWLKKEGDAEPRTKRCWRSPPIRWTVKYPLLRRCDQQDPVSGRRRGGSRCSLPSSAAKAAKRSSRHSRWRNLYNNRPCGAGNIVRETFQLLCSTQQFNRMQVMPTASTFPGAQHRPSGRWSMAELETFLAPEKTAGHQGRYPCLGTQQDQWHSTAADHHSGRRGETGSTSNPNGGKERGNCSDQRQHFSSWRQCRDRGDGLHAQAHRRPYGHEQAYQSA